MGETTTEKYQQWLSEQELSDSKDNFDRFCREVMSPVWADSLDEISSCDHEFIKAPDDFLSKLAPWLCTKCRCRASGITH